MPFIVYTGSQMTFHHCATFSLAKTASIFPAAPPKTQLNVSFISHWQQQAPVCQAASTQRIQQSASLEAIYHGCCWCFSTFIWTCNLYGPCVVIWMNMSAVQEGWHGDTGVTGTLLPFWFQGWNKNTELTVSVDYMCRAQAGTLRRNS